MLYYTQKFILASQTPSDPEPEPEPDPTPEPTKRLGDLQVGDRVVDPSWEWEFRSGDDYTLDSGAGDPTKPVTWIVVAKDHYLGWSPT